MNEVKSCCAARRTTENPVTDAMAIVQSGNLSLENMVKIPSGEFLMGTDDSEGFPADGEGPVRSVMVNEFLIDTTTVTNRQFAGFVAATGYITDAERFGWSFVFDKLLPEETKAVSFDVAAETPWWCMVPGAYWAQPEGDKSSIQELMDHPVVHVSWNDAMAYCNWAGKRLPMETEWEKAARGDLVQQKYPWGNEFTPGGVHHCNIWQGSFPNFNSLDDGYLGTAPARSYQPNGYGLYNTSGNVWEWCADWFDAQQTARVIKGGSFLCHHSYCNRYRVAARSANTPDSSSSNTGFRCVANQ